MFLVLKVKDCVPHDRQACKTNIEHLVNKGVIQGLAREHRVESKPELSHDIKHVFVESVANQV
jgi:hypothetical protein